MPHKLENYLRTYRRRAGLSQDEMAFLLGTKSGTKVSRYEHRLVPPVRCLTVPKENRRLSPGSLAFLIYWTLTIAIPAACGTGCRDPVGVRWPVL